MVNTMRYVQGGKYCEVCRVWQMLLGMPSVVNTMRYVQGGKYYEVC